MPIFQSGSLNTTALIVPDLYVQIVPPNVILLNGVPSNVLGIVGTASWGPVNQPAVIGNMGQYFQFFGPVLPRKYDAGTTTALAVLQGAQQFRIIRVTDGTDTAASVQVSLTDNTQQITIGGTVTNGDVVTINITPFGGVLQAFAYTVQSSDTVQSIATALANLINASTALQSAGINADTPAGGTFKLHWSGSSPTVSRSVTGAATETVTLGTVSSTSTTQITFTSAYTGSYGSNEVVNILNGSAVGSWKVVVTMPGLVPETFDNIGAGLKGNQVWIAIANAINNGVSGIRGPSQYLKATAGPGASTPIVQQYSLTGGTDGYSGVGTAQMIGVDVLPRTGMYCMRNQGISIGILSDVSDSSSWSTQVSFGLFEGIYMIAVGPPSDTILNAATPVTGSKFVAGIDSYAIKMMFGDWCYWFDTVNNIVRLVSPQGIVGGLLSNLSPQYSALNRQVYGIIGTQKSLTGLTYTAADLQALGGAGWDVICNPIPQGPVFGVRFGRNSSSNAVIHGDNYTRMTNYIAATLNKGMGIYVGALQSRRPTDITRQQVKATLDAFMQALLDQRMIDDYQNICDNSNNPVTQIALGYLQADCQVVYLAVVEYFIVNLQGGQSVQINKISTAPVTTINFAATPTVNTAVTAATQF